MATLTNIAKHSATLTNRAKNVISAASGGMVFYGWMFLFTTTNAGQITNISKHAASLTNVPKH